MMGVADFPMDIFEAFSNRRSDFSNPENSTSSSASRASSKPNLVREESNLSRATTSTRQSFVPDPPNTSRTSSEHGINRPSTANSRQGGITPSTLFGGLDDGTASTTSVTNQAGTSNVDEEQPSRPLLPKLSQKDDASQLSPTSSSDNVQPVSLESALGAGKGIGRIVGAGLKSPMDFTLNLAKGFHNAPKLYGDESVRKADRVTGLNSGLRAAGKVQYVTTICVV